MNERENKILTHLKKLRPEQRDRFWQLYANARKDKGVACLLSLLGGFVGLHRAYLGQLRVAIIFVFTLGFFGLGLLHDWIRMGDVIKDANIEIKENILENEMMD